MMMSAAATGQTCPPYVSPGYIDLPTQTPPKVWAIEHAEGVTRISGEFTFPGHETADWLAIDDGSGLRPVIRDVRVSGIRTLPMPGGPETFVFGGPTVARWTETGLEQLGGGIGTVFAVEAFDDGSGPMLYAGGELRIDRVACNVARWTGQKWEIPGAVLHQRPAYTLAVFDDGAGPALYAGGRFDSGSFPGDSLARWDGRQWSFVDGPQGIINELKVVELNGQSILVAAGQIDFPGESWALVAATWDGVKWRPVGDPSYSVSFHIGPGGTKSPIWTMTPIVRDRALMVYVAGDFLLRPPGQFIRWVAFHDGAQWHMAHPLVEVLDSAPTPDGQAIAAATPPITHPLGFPLAGLITVAPCSCRADLDGDGELTLFDFLAFQTLFAARHLHADFDGDGELTFFDFLAFQNEFAAGCP